MSTRLTRHVSFCRSVNGPKRYCQTEIGVEGVRQAPLPPPWRPMMFMNSARVRGSERK